MFYVPSPVPDDTSSKGSPPEEKYEAEWRFLTSEKDINVLKNYSTNGSLSSSSIRSIHWRVLLGIFPVASPAEWLNIVRLSRKEYDDIKNEFSLDPRASSSLPDDNPLSQDENSLWYKYFCDNELKRVIKQDVIRTSPEKMFFQLTYVQDVMINVLFYYARRNPTLCYRQGMHEILAPLLLVIHEDYEAFKKIGRISVMNSIISEIMDANHLESDVFHLFSFVMRFMAKYYEVDSVPTASGHFPSQNLPQKQNDSAAHAFESSICLLLNSIRDDILLKYDRQLYNHLTELNIPFTAFGIRWLRLLYGREFLFQDLLILWDAIFALQSDFDISNYILVAMLIAVRDKILNNDYMECLNCLMKYPSTVDIKFVINYAMYLNNPSFYPEPSLQNLKTKSNDQTFQSKNSSSNRLSNLKSASSRHLNIAKRLKNLKINTTKKNSKESGDINLDDCPTNFEIIVAELKQMQVVMSLCKLKLYQYHEILSASVSSEDTKAQLALTGIQELCTLLDIDHFSMKSSENDSLAVENAREAQEMQQTNSEIDNSFLRPSVDAVALYLPPPNSDIDMKIFKPTEYESTDLSKFPAEDPLKLIKD